MRSVKVTLVSGMVLMVLVGALTLTHAPQRVIRGGERQNSILALVKNDVTICQANEVLPAGVSAVRIPLDVFYGSRLRVAVYSGSQVLAEGRRGASWTGKSVTVPVKPLNRTISRVTFCFAIAPNSEPIRVFGDSTASAGESARFWTGGKLTPTVAASEGGALEGRVNVEYLAAGGGSWWSRATTVARHVGIGRFLSGTWVVLLILALMVAVGVLALRLASRDIGVGKASPRRRRSTGKLTIRAWGTLPAGVRSVLRRAPTAAWVCALIAFLNAFAWSLIVPPLQGRDEVDHFAYVAQLAQRGTLPKHGGESGSYSPQQSLVLEGIHYRQVVHTTVVHAISSMAQQRKLMEDVHAGASLEGSGEVGVASSEPPLYYALQLIPYGLASGNILAQVQLMRLVGALFGAITALLVFLFIREALPGVPWAATVGGLCVALQPLFAFMSGSVNPDAMLFTVSAGVFLCLARAFRRGFTRRLAAVLGALIAVGFMTKLNFIGFAFGVFAGLVVLALRERKVRGREAFVTLAIAAGIGLVPVGIYVLRNLLSGRSTLGLVAGSAEMIFGESLFDQFSYTWQMYLPRLPGMTPYFKGMMTYRDIWFDRSVGFYGWMDTVFPTWVDSIALLPAGAVALLCGRELLARRDALRARLPELCVYAAIILGVLVMVGVSSYDSDIVRHQYAFGEPRYLLPMLALLGAVIALAVRGAGRKWAPVVGAAMVVLFLGHDIFSQLQVIARYYG